MIKLEHVHIWFGKGSIHERHALDDINLTIKEQEFVIVLGNNGAGKSTLMHVLSGEIKPSSGDIYVDDMNMHQMKKTECAALVSRVHQQAHFGSWGELTIEENLNLSFMRGKARGLAYGTPKTRAEDFKKRIAVLGLGLEDKLHIRMDSLSGGQRQAVNLVMATLAPTKLLLLDEHTSALDPSMSKLVMTLTDLLIKELKLTTLMITHRLHDASEYGNRIIFLQQGKIKHDIDQEQKQSMSHLDMLNWVEEEI